MYYLFGALTTRDPERLTNIGFNVGVAAGQTIWHLHVHLIPRYAGDVTHPRGGIRQVIPGRGDYQADSALSSIEPGLRHLGTRHSALGTRHGLRRQLQLEQHRSSGRHRVQLPRHHVARPGRVRVIEL